MSATLLGERTLVPAEFRGLARQFRTAVQVEDKAFDRALAVICKPLRLRLRSHPKLRHETIAGAVRLYRLTVPADFRLSEPTIEPDRETFAISERRVTASWLHDTKWEYADGYDEPGIGLCTFTLALDRGRLRERWAPIAVVSFHALARYFERSGKRDHADLLADLRLLLVAQDGDEVPTERGSWIGAVITMKDKHGTARARSIRTYHW
jgi:hypothetical protein